MIGFVKSLSLWILKCQDCVRDGEASRISDAIRRGPRNQERPCRHAAHSPMPLPLPVVSCYLLADRCYPAYPLACVPRMPIVRFKIGVSPGFCTEDLCVSPGQEMRFPCSC